MQNQSSSNDIDMKAVFSETASPYLILSPALIIVEVNNAYLQSTCRGRDDLLGQYVFDAFPDNPNDPLANGVRNLHASLLRVIQTRNADTMAVQKYDIPIGDPKAGRFEERYWRPINTPILDAHGELTHIIHHVEDVTAQLHSEAALRESETRFKTLITATAEVIYRMSPDWSEIYELQGRGFLKDVHQPKKMWLDEYVLPEDYEVLHQAIAIAIAQKNKLELELRVKLATGGIGWIETRAVPVLDEDGNITEWLGASTDITARKVAEEELKETVRRKDDFLAMLAHELRNPLSPITAAAELLNLVNHNDEKIKQCSQIISRQVKHMTSLVDDLLDVSRVTRGLIVLEQEKIDLNEIIIDSAEQVKPLIESYQHHLSLKTPPNPVYVMGDRNRLIQVLTNILNNAAKYTPAGGQIDLILEVQETYASIVIKDNGIGMEPELINQAFELFTQASRTSDRSQGGLGVGLALVKSLIALHQGTVKAASEGLDKGSQFTILLPHLQTANEVKASSETEFSPLEAHQRQTKVMVVDDNVDAADMIGLLLEISGYQVIIEYSSLKAIERAKSEKPCICILDIGLPQMDGKELATRLKAQAETANAKLIALTGYSEEQESINALEAGFDHYLVKPVDTNKLLGLLNSF